MNITYEEQQLMALYNSSGTRTGLIAALREAGVKSTQATVSRDMRELRLVKRLNDDGSYRYVCPEEPLDAPDHSDRLRTIFRESVASCATAQNLVVVKTLNCVVVACMVVLVRVELSAGSVGLHIFSFD